MIASRKDRVLLIGSGGIGLHAIPNRYDARGRPFDYIVCCTKNIPDIIPTLCDIIAPAVTPGHTAIVLIQNGLNIERPFIHRFPNNVIISSISRIDAHEITPGVIEQKQNDLLHIGAFNKPSLHSKWPSVFFFSFSFSIPSKTSISIGNVEQHANTDARIRKRGASRFQDETRAQKIENRLPNVQAEAHQVPSLQTFTGAAPNLGLLDLELMHNFCTSTYATLSNDVTVRDLWRIRIVRLCLKCEYAMLAVLSVSALHLSHFSTERKEFLRQRAIVYHNQALTIAAPFIDAYDNANAQELFAFSILTIYYSFAQTPDQEDGPYPPWVVLISGCTSFISLSDNTLLLGPFSALLSKARAHLDRRLQAFKTDYTQQLRTFVDESVTDPARRSIYQEALVALNQTYGVFYETVGDKDLVDIFSWVVPAKAFFEFVADEEPEALVVLSYFCVLLHKLPSQWWLTGWVNHIMSRIYGSVGEKYLSYLVWPMEEIGWLPKQ
ncbi:2-dehydropantoate 2-reductase [Fusarium mundagurra]|uniref:2-dehydropantoate 2-reductase n=1 Tax=Fusarium mundagurra TaxID=1567541 RepID=A0A8H6DQK4_9HYPO|nr:2-dehydropantoate 2-reductase [Fusarium mundagurra]